MMPHKLLLFHQPFTYWADMFLSNKRSAQNATRASRRQLLPQICNHVSTCRRRYVREEVLESQFTALLGQLQFDDEVLGWVHDALHASHVDERCEHEEAIKRFQAEHKRLGDRINAMYLDKLDGRVDGTFFDKMSAEWREDQSRCLREIERHESAEQSYMDGGVQILELARKAQRLFERQEPREKRRLLNFVLSNCTWEDGELVATFRQPFDLLAKTTAIAARLEATNAANSAKSEIWLAFLDTVRTERFCDVVHLQSAIPNFAHAA